MVAGSSMLKGIPVCVVCVCCAVCVLGVVCIVYRCLFGVCMCVPVCVSYVSPAAKVAHVDLCACCVGSTVTAGRAVSSFIPPWRHALFTTPPRTQKVVGCCFLFVL